MHTYKKPNGEYTHSPEEYLNSWYEIINPLEEKLNIKVFGFDPGMTAQDNESRATVDIPLWLARRIIE